MNGLRIVVECGQNIIVSCLDLASGMMQKKHGLRINLISTKSTMSNKVWKGVCLCVILFVGDPFINLPQVNAMPVTQLELAHNTPQT